MKIAPPESSFACSRSVSSRTAACAGAASSVTASASANPRRPLIRDRIVARRIPRTRGDLGRGGTYCPTGSRTAAPTPLSNMDRTRRIPLVFAVLLGVLTLGGPVSQAAPAKKPAPDAVPGELLVGFRGDVSAADQKSILKSVGATDKKDFKKIHGSLLHA